MERLAKRIRKAFEEEGFKITVEYGMNKTEFLDVFFDLENDCYRPFRKKNSSISYVDRRSNHPRNVLNQIPKTINERLTRLSKNEETFKNYSQQYQKALVNSDYNYPLVYGKKENDGNKKRKRKRRIIYYNPPFCNSVSTNIGRKFIQLIDKIFTADHPYRKIFNRNSLKLSYSCMPNIKRIIHAHNWKILNSTKEKQEQKCNCRKKKECPVQGKCQVANVIYRASLRNDGITKYYVGSTGMKFKDRYALHKSSFNKKDSKATELAKAVCELKRTNKNFELSWEIICRTRKKFDLKSGCKLCNLEKIEISQIKKEESLNKRTELQSICPHYRNMFL